MASLISFLFSSFPSVSSVPRWWNYRLESMLSPTEMPPCKRLSILPRWHFSEVRTDPPGAPSSTHHQTDGSRAETAVLPTPPPRRTPLCWCCVMLGAALGQRCSRRPNGQSSSGNDLKGHFFKHQVTDYFAHRIFYTYVSFSKLPSQQLFWILSRNFWELFIFFSSD